MIENILTSSLNYMEWMTVLILIVPFIVSIYFYKEYYGKSIVDYTEFIYEDGNTYYFRICSRNSILYHDIKVYEKKKFYNYNFYKQIGVSKMIQVDFRSHHIKNEVNCILRSKTFKLDNWDGFIGDIPDDIKKSLQREKRLSKVLDK